MLCSMIYLIELYTLIYINDDDNNIDNIYGLNVYILVYIINIWKHNLWTIFIKFSDDDTLNDYSTANLTITNQGDNEVTYR